MGIATIREARPEDVAALHAINAAGQPGVAPLTAHEASAIAARATPCWVAEESGGVRGYLIAYTASDVYDGEEFAWFQQRYAAFLYIDQIAVSPESRHSGVGSQLYQVAGEYARAHGLNILTCEVNVEPPNPISLRFHRALGFQDVGVLHTVDGRTVALLRLDVSTPPDAAATS
jgi:uncharacterized protein